jgi:olefin beta-lactone synthetase
LKKENKFTLHYTRFTKFKAPSFIEDLPMTSNFYSIIHKNLVDHQDKCFLKFLDREKASQHSGNEILKGVARVCQTLEKRNIKKGDKILVAVPFSFHFVCVFLGIMAYGAIPVLPPAVTGKINLLNIILQQNIKNVFFEHRKTILNFLLKVIRVKSITTNFEFEKPAFYEFQLVSGLQPAFISFSSGSTGRPTPVERGHQILLEQHLALKRSFPPLTEQKDFPLFPNILLHNLCLGITTVIPDIPELDIRKMQPEKIVKQMREEQIDSLTGNVFYFKKILAYLLTTGETIAHVKELGIGGSPVPEYLPHLLKKHFINANIYIIYGSTQAEPIAVRKIEDELVKPELGYFVGRLHPNIEMEIRDPKAFTKRTKTYLAGSISVRGKHVVPGTDSEWLETGDYGYLDENGELFLTGRSGNENIIQGFTHYQIEHTLTNLPGVEHAAAIAVNSAFKLYIEGSADLSEINISLKNHFPETIISSVEKIEVMPVDPRHHSKILYRNLCTPNLKM